MRSVEVIIEKLHQLQTNYQSNKALILTESDLKCQLFRLIYELFPIDNSTFSEEITGCAVHSEVKFFDEDGKLTLVPDIIIVNTENISIYHSTEYVFKKGIPQYRSNPSKNFTIAGGAILIELKFCRDKIGINDTDIISYQNDINKMIRIKEIIERQTSGEEKVYGIFAAFNKTNNGNEKFQEFRQNNIINEDINIFYGTGLVDFNNTTQFPFSNLDE
ncbi:hypothetical protein [Soonwooa buanensis]|uniref:hypothetical protein n=1 Tax=Soonwooa buanensis TaxID=619805 RepID=UPI0011818C26|nr:hypothetical protein [Soonwooa buanensis]